MIWRLVRPVPGTASENTLHIEVVAAVVCSAFVHSRVRVSQIGVTSVI